MKRLTLPAVLLACALALLSVSDELPAQAQAGAWDQGYLVEKPRAVLSQRDQAAAINRMLRDRLDNLLPRLMRESGLDMWLVIARESNEDPVYLTLVPEPVFAARRTTMLVFFDRGASDRGEDLGVERLIVSRYDLGDFYASVWDGGDADSQWRRLAEVIAERSPRRIGINCSEHWAFGDGLSSGLRARLDKALADGPETVTGQVVSAEALCIRWLETRTRAELEVYPQIVQLARQVIAEAFSNAVVTPGVTTTQDVRWWLRQRFSDLGLPVWFQPYCNVQRAGAPPGEDAVIFGDSDTVIRRGDLLHTDVGIRYLRLCTDTQEMAYVLRMGEEDVPRVLLDAMAIGNRWQDCLTGSFATGRTGNEVLARTRAEAARAGIECSVYTHPLGPFGHSAGPTIGMWDNQGPTPIRGDWLVHPDTCYAIEGNVTVRVPEWGDQRVQIKLEQDAWFDGERVVYLGGRQTRFHVIR